MLLSAPDAYLFFKLHRTLMFFVNQRLSVVTQPLADPTDFARQSTETRLRVRDAFLAHKHLIEEFVGGNPAGLPDDELDIVRSWQHLVAGKFYIFRELKKHTVFLSSAEQLVAYGVLALTQPFEELVGPRLPVLVTTVLLPFKDRIVYDGIVSSFRISFGPGIRRALNDSFREAKARHGIITSLPVPQETRLATAAAAGTRQRSKRDATVKNSFAGRWRITYMEVWDQDFVDAEGQGYIEFDARNSGEFQFGFVHGFMDCRATTREGEPAIEWTWDGNDEMDPAQGRGWAILKGSELHGMLFCIRATSPALWRKEKRSHGGGDKSESELVAPPDGCREAH